MCPGQRTNQQDNLGRKQNKTTIKEQTGNSVRIGFTNALRIER
jgi:hypothetical protein